MSTWAALCALGASGCLAMAMAGHMTSNSAGARSKRAWAEAQHSAVLLTNPAVAGRLITEGRQDLGIMIVGVRSYSSDALCFSVEADSQRIWPEVVGFDMVVLAHANQEEEQAAIQSNAVQSPLGTRTIRRTERETVGANDPRYIRLDVPYEERAVCFAAPQVLGQDAAQLMLRINYRAGSHAYIAWQLTTAMPPS